MKLLNDSLNLGADPEVFLKREGKVIGSERVIPEEGLRAGDTAWLPHKIVRDGIQVEFNPYPNGGRTEAFQEGMNRMLQKLKNHLKEHPGVEISYDLTVEVPAEEFAGLSEKSRELGCQPSENWYGPNPIKVDRFTYPFRSAGGHLHFGLPYWALPDSRYFKFEDIRRRLPPLFDIFIGNTCVLIDRDPMAAFRRENYGRAGEYRLPDHGIEYRTLSNFWLLSPTLMDLVFSLGKVAFQVLSTTVNPTVARFSLADVEGELAEYIPGKGIKKFERAINKNDAKAALKNLLTIKPFIDKYGEENAWPIHAKNFDKFMKFVQVVQKEGLRTFFQDDPVTAWGSKIVYWNNFIEQV